jgi:hypothetical protein
MNQLSYKASSLSEVSFKEASSSLLEELKEETDKFLENPSVTSFENLRELMQELQDVLEELVIEYD